MKHMWGEPRKGTEAAKVQQLAEARKRQAKDKGYDKLLVDVYFEKLEGLAKRIKNHENWRKYKHPGIKKLKEEEIDLNDFKSKLSFEYNGFAYSVFKSSRHIPGYGDHYYFYLNLHRDNKKVFGLMVEEYSGQYATNYSPGLVTAYSSDEWVRDFQEIQEYYEMASKNAEIAYAEDPDKTNKLKEEFGISDNDLTTTSENDSPNASNILDGYFIQKGWLWVLVMVGILMLLAAQ